MHAIVPLHERLSLTFGLKLGAAIFDLCQSLRDQILRLSFHLANNHVKHLLLRPIHTLNKFIILLLLGNL